MRDNEATYGYINLLALIDSLLVEFEGDDGIFIPFRSNPSLYVSDRGVNLRVKLTPMKAGKDINGNTHVAYANTTKDLLDAMSEEERKILLPFLGKFYPYKNAKPGTVEPIISSAPVARRLVPEVAPDPVKEKDPFDDIAL